MTLVAMTPDTAPPTIAADRRSSGIGADAGPQALTAVRRPMMGGQVSVHLRDSLDPAALAAAAERVLSRMEAWAGRLTRFDAGSELVRLNATRGPAAAGPTLAAVLDWARVAEGLTHGIVDIALLDARLAAEHGTALAPAPPACRRWSMRRTPRGALVERAEGVRFDLDGVAKGWLADRALSILRARSGLVDADGDIAIRLAPGDEWAIGIADPRDPDATLGVVRLTAEARGRRWGLATSGTSVHRWAHGDVPAHHLIDPATGRPAVTDVVQATVLAESARVAEAFAKTAVIVGAGRAFDLSGRPGVHGILLLTDDGLVRTDRGMLRWLA